MRPPTTELTSGIPPARSQYASGSAKREPRGPRVFRLRPLESGPGARHEDLGAGPKWVDSRADPKPGRWFVFGEDLPDSLRPSEGCAGILVRVIRYTLDDPQRVGHGEVHTLITNLYDVDLSPTKDLIILYYERWEQELVYDEQKTHQDPPRVTKPRICGARRRRV